MYQLKDKVVYPGHGVAVIESIIEKKVGENNLSFFKLKFLYKDMTILVPIATTSYTIRHLCSWKEIDLALGELNKPTKKLETLDFTPSSWNKRNKTYQLKIQSGNLLDIAVIYRDLMITSKYKDLSFGEKNLLQLAEELLLQEILEVKNQSRETIMQELRRPFKQVTLNNSIGDNKVFVNRVSQI